MRRIVGLILALMLLLTATGAAADSMADKQPKPPLTREQKLEDFGYLCTQLEQQHVGFSELVDSAEWEQRKRDFIAGIGEEDNTTFCLDLMQFVARLGVSHTKAQITGAEHDAMGCLPLIGQWFGDELRVIATIRGYEQCLGQKVVAVEDVPIPELMERLRALISCENEVRLRQQFLENWILADALAYLGVADDPDSVTVTFEDDAGQRSEVRVQTLRGAVWSLNFIPLAREAVPAAEQAQSLYSCSALGEDALLISYNGCAEDPELPMAEFAGQVQDEIERLNPSKIAIDLRYNGGGNAAVFLPVIEMLDSQQKRRGFQLYTLISEDTYSAALQTAILTKYNEAMEDKGTLLVGQSTSSSINHYGEIVWTALPNAPLSLSYCTKLFNWMPERGSEPLAPDIPVARSFDAYMRGVDQELEAVLQHQPK